MITSLVICCRRLAAGHRPPPALRCTAPPAASACRRCHPTATPTGTWPRWGTPSRYSTSLLTELDDTLSRHIPSKVTNSILSPDNELCHLALQGVRVLLWGSRFQRAHVENQPRVRILAALSNKPDAIDSPLERLSTLNIIMSYNQDGGDGRIVLETVTGVIPLESVTCLPPIRSPHSKSLCLSRDIH